MGSTRTGDKSQLHNNTYPSARPISSPLEPTPAPVPVSAMSHPTRHFLNTRNNPGNYCAATLVLKNHCPTLFYHTTPATSPSSPTDLCQFTLRYDYASLHPRQTQLCTSPTTPPGFPMHKIFQLDTIATCHAAPKYLKQSVLRGTYCNILLYP